MKFKSDCRKRGERVTTRLQRTLPQLRRAQAVKPWRKQHQKKQRIPEQDQQENAAEAAKEGQKVPHHPTITPSSALFVCPEAHRKRSREEP